jgi:hypothetical protein
MDMLEILLSIVLSSLIMEDVINPKRLNDSLTS